MQFEIANFWDIKYAQFGTSVRFSYLQKIIQLNFKLSKIILFYIHIHTFEFSWMVCSPDTQFEFECLLLFYGFAMCRRLFLGFNGCYEPN